MKKQKKKNNNITSIRPYNALHLFRCKAFSRLQILIKWNTAIGLCLLLILTHSPVSAQYPLHPALKAQAFWVNQQTDSALAILSQLIEGKHNTEKWLMIRSQIYFKNGQTSEAINDLQQAEKKRPGIATYMLAKTYALKRDTAKTLLYLEKNLNSAYKVTKNVIMQEKSFYFLYKTDQWKKLWEKEWYNRYEYYEGEMRYQYEAGNWTAVINMMADMGKDARRLSAHAFYMTAMAYLKLENYAAALNYFSLALSKSKKESLYYAARGDCYLQMKNYAKALDDYTQAIGLSPEIPAYYLQYIRALMGVKKSDAAYETALAMSQLFPADNEVLYVFAEVAYQNKLYLQALTYINQLINPSPDDSAYLHLRALCYTKTAMITQALKDYDKLLQKYPRQPIYWFERGWLYFQINEKQKACNDWQQSARLGSPKASQLLWENCGR